MNVDSVRDGVEPDRYRSSDMKHFKDHSCHENGSVEMEKVVHLPMYGCSNSYDAIHSQSDNTTLTTWEDSHEHGNDVDDPFDLDNNLCDDECDLALNGSLDGIVPADGGHDEEYWSLSDNLAEARRIVAVVEPAPISAAEPVSVFLVAQLLGSPSRRPRLLPTQGSSDESCGPMGMDKLMHLSLNASTASYDTVNTDNATLATWEDSRTDHHKNYDDPFNLDDDDGDSSLDGSLDDSVHGYGQGQGKWSPKGNGAWSPSKGNWLASPNPVNDGRRARVNSGCLCSPIGLTLNVKDIAPPLYGCPTPCSDDSENDGFLSSPIVLNLSNLQYPWESHASPVSIVQLRRHRVSDDNPFRSREGLRTGPSVESLIALTGIKRYSSVD